MCYYVIVTCCLVRTSGHIVVGSCCFIAARCIVGYERFPHVRM